MIRTSGGIPLGIPLGLGLLGLDALLEVLVVCALLAVLLEDLRRTASAGGSERSKKRETDLLELVELPVGLVCRLVLSCLQGTDEPLSLYHRSSINALW